MSPWRDHHRIRSFRTDDSEGRFK